jgi:alpha-ketoglutaric semialdehyde dehydrogenase
VDGEIRGGTLIQRHGILVPVSGIRSFSVAKDCDIEPIFGIAGQAELEYAYEIALDCATAFAHIKTAIKAKFFSQLAEMLGRISEPLIQRAMLETGAMDSCARSRLADIHLAISAIVEHLRKLSPPDHSAAEAPTGHLSGRWLTPIGPVVFWSSCSVPTLFAAASSEVLAALAAGCPVIFMANETEMGLGELIGHAIQSCAASSGLPSGVFSLLHATDPKAPLSLASNHGIAAVSYQGTVEECESVAIHLARHHATLSVFTKSSDINPTFFLPQALNARAEHFAAEFVEQYTHCVGQASGRSAVTIAIDGDGLIDLQESLVEAVERKPAELLFSREICHKFLARLELLKSSESAKLIGEGPASERPWTGRATLFKMSAHEVILDPSMLEHCVGPAAALIVCADYREMLELAEILGPQAKIDVHMEQEDEALARQLLSRLERTAKRIVCVSRVPRIIPPTQDRHPTVCENETSTSASAFGAHEIQRFLRTIDYVRLPATLAARNQQQA